MSKSRSRKLKTSPISTTKTSSRLGRFKPSRAQMISGALIFSASIFAFAAFPALNSFTAGTPISASAVNANFTALEARIAALETKLASVSNVTVNGQPAVRFTGVNVQVVNGLGSTATANGTGNLIVGYDEADASGAAHCTIGTDPSSGTPVIDVTTCGTAGGIWWGSGGFKTGSHYVVTGSQNNYSRWGGLLAGLLNTSNYDYANVSGGTNNTASGPYSSVSGGNFNRASGLNSSVSGGDQHTASGQYSSVSGGSLNTASGYAAAVSGGGTNNASGSFASVSGGGSNTASVGAYASVSGGAGNTASGGYASVSGGLSCSTAGVFYKWTVGGSTTYGCSATLGN